MHSLADNMKDNYRAVQQGYIRPFSDLYAAVENDLYGRIIKFALSLISHEFYQLMALLLGSFAISYQIMCLHQDRRPRMVSDP